MIKLFKGLTVTEIIWTVPILLYTVVVGICIIIDCICKLMHTTPLTSILDYNPFWISLGIVALYSWFMFFLNIVLSIRKISK